MNKKNKIKELREAIKIMTDWEREDSVSKYSWKNTAIELGRRLVYCQYEKEYINEDRRQTKIRKKQKKFEKRLSKKANK